MATTRGAAQTQRNFKRASERIRRMRKDFVGKGVPPVLRVIGEEMMTDMKASRGGAGVPRDKGILAGTGRVTGPTNGEVEMSFGGASAPYARKQHQDESLRHTVGEARWMIRAVERWTPDGSSAIRALEQNLKEAVLRAGGSLN